MHLQVKLRCERRMNRVITIKYLEESRNVCCDDDRGGGSVTTTKMLGWERCLYAIGRLSAVG